MARLTTLTVLRQMFNAETGGALDETVNPGNASALNVMLANQQKWLAGKFDWPFLKARASVDLAAGDRYVSFPTSSLSYERLPGEQTVKLSSVRYPVEFGIKERDLAQWDSDDSAQRADPVRKWDMVDQSGTIKIEVWPRPATAQTLILTGFRPLAALTGDSDTCDLDDLLIVLFTAAEFLARDKKQDAGAKLAKAQARLNELRANLPARDETFILGGANPWARRNYGTTNLDRRPTVAVSPA